jgi:hypothetical protein
MHATKRKLDAWLLGHGNKDLVRELVNPIPVLILVWALWITTLRRRFAVFLPEPHVLQGSLVWLASWVIDGSIERDEQDACGGRTLSTDTLTGLAAAVRCSRLILIQPSPCSHSM